MEQQDYTIRGNELFPVFLKLDHLRILIIGGGKVGLEKLEAVANNSPAAAVTLIAITICEEIKEFAKDNLTLIEKEFEASDLIDHDIIIAAVNVKATSLLIHAEAKKLNKWINVADTPELCDFYLSSIVRKGDLKIAISTNGKSPTAAKRIKEVLNEAMPQELDEVINNLHTVRKSLNGNFETKVKKLNALTKILVEKESDAGRKWKRIVTYSLAAFAFMLIGYFIFSYIPLKEIATGTIGWYRSLDKNFSWMMLAGFIAQLVDGSLGMGYGVTSATVLLSVGISPAAISGSIHTAEMFASGASGYSHYKFGNVNKKLFKALVIPGVLGAIAGALLLVFLGERFGNYIRPIIAIYTLFLGIKFIINAFRKTKAAKKFKQYSILAGVGGFFDSFGGGGWGPIVTSTLINTGRSHRYVVGTVSMTEFFVTLASAFTFFAVIGVSHWQVILALMIGGTVAAPLAAKLAGRLPRKTAFLLLGLLVIFWSIRILIKIF